MKRRNFLMSVAATPLVAGCASTPAVSKFRSYEGPEVTSIVVNKAARRMYLLNGEDILKSYDVDLGFSPEGPKRVRGDGKTPEGTYLIDRRNPNSDFHLSLGISYPNTRDRAIARQLGQNPGGDIFIHGKPNLRAARKKARSPDWTAGCISVENEEMEEIYAMVSRGTIITIRP